MGESYGVRFHKENVIQVKFICDLHVVSDQCIDAYSIARERSMMGQHTVPGPCYRARDGSKVHSVSQAVWAVYPHVHTLSSVWWMRVGPNCLKPRNPMSGSPTRAGPS